MGSAVVPDPSKPLRNVRHELYAQGRALRALRPGDAYTAMGGVSKNPRKQAGKIEATPGVRERIAWLQADVAAEAKEDILYDKRYVIQELMENVEESKRGVVVQKGEVVKDPDTGENVLKREPMAINRALELLGMDIGMFPKVNRLSVSHEDAFESMSTDEILKEVQLRLIDELGWEVDFDDLNRLIERARTGEGIGDQPVEDARPEDRAVPALPEAAGVPRDGAGEA